MFKLTCSYELDWSFLKFWIHPFIHITKNVDCLLVHFHSWISKSNCCYTNTLCAIVQMSPYKDYLKSNWSNNGKFHIKTSSRSFFFIPRCAFYGILEITWGIYQSIRMVSHLNTCIWSFNRTSIIKKVNICKS